MVKRTITLFVALALLIPAAQAGEKLTWRDCTKVFTWANAVEKSRVIDGRLYGEAWHLSYARDREDEFLGYVFLSSLSAAGQDINLIVGITPAGKIAKITTKEQGVADAEFLAQFEGRSAGSDFRLAQSGDDLTTTPSRLKTIRGKEALSMAIIREVGDILKTATGAAGMTPAL